MSQHHSRFQSGCWFKYLKQEPNTNVDFPRKGLTPASCSDSDVWDLSKAANVNDLALRLELLLLPHTHTLIASIKPTWYVNSRCTYLHDCSPFAGWSLTRWRRIHAPFKCVPDCWLWKRGGCGGGDGKGYLSWEFVMYSRHAVRSFAEKDVVCCFEGK